MAGLGGDFMTEAGPRRPLAADATSEALEITGGAFRGVHMRDEDARPTPDARAPLSFDLVRPTGDGVAGREGGR